MEIGSSSDKIFKLYDQLELLEYQDKFVVKSLESPDQGFSISRREGNIETLSDASSSEKPSKTSAIYGVAGTIRLLAGTYLLVITSRKEVGSFLGFPVYRVESMKFLACNEALRFSNSQEKRDEAYFMTLLKTVEATPGLYYSYETDITLNLQRRCKLMEGWMSKPIWKQADPRFVWNKHLLEELIEYKLDEFIIPLLQGSFQMAQLELKNSPTTCTLLSRRCTRRLGTRMWRRGANLEGDTANFIETEQLLELEGFRCSLLQIRGSIPLLWEQIVDLSYKPRLRIINHEHTVYFFLKIQHFLFLSFSLNSGAYDLTLHFQLFIQPQVVERHFHDLFQRYGETIALDLTEKLSRYFLIDTDGNILEEQKGIIRSNCIDCLDRTNVTQSYLARKSLNIQLQRLGVFTSTECIPLFAEDYGKFRTLWAEQGDEISLEYAGTHALKGDLVRYGKQTVAGLIKDGMSAVSRYYLNNFHDGIRQFHVFQDALDLVSGRYTVSRNNPSPFQLNSFESFSYLPVASALLVGGLTLTTFTIQQAGRSAQHYVSSVFWAGVTAGVMALVKANGRQFCSRPRLCGLL
ncbi:phosphoinositide phosphatase SAC8 isoform X6 [Durio zibethinus]|uniref:Phosphoinositide phosphatase SAC8 isoform X6 n=1 Tax=Durio zibethinus TaxID=66656 RepID=A0A6P6ASD7_DURZI|nr:phosphoinositide phosphatase SAC8 isoform X6 [Durio zibethinus]